MGGWVVGGWGGRGMGKDWGGRGVGVWRNGKWGARERGTKRPRGHVAKMAELHKEQKSGEGERSSGAGEV